VCSVARSIAIVYRSPSAAPTRSPAPGSPRWPPWSKKRSSPKKNLLARSGVALQEGA